MSAPTDVSDSSGTTDLAPLFAPRRVAVVGASSTPGKLGAAMADSLATFGSNGGDVVLVNHRDPAFAPSLGAAAEDGPIDLAVLCVPAPVCPLVIEDAAGAGVSAVMICSGGFAEVDAAGAELQDDLLARARAGGVRVLGPNTSGFLAPHAHLTATFVPGAAAISPGRIAVVAASGGVNHALAFLLAEAGHGVSLAVGLGNAVDVDASAVLDHLADDDTTSAVALHVESIADGRRLVESVQRLSVHRPVVALVVGRNDVADFAASHTGNLATSWRVTRAALAQAGAVVVDDERQLVDAVGALSITRAPAAANPSVGVVTAQAGPGLLLLDDLRGRGIRVPELTVTTRDRLSGLLPPMTFQQNPVDTGRPGPEFAEVLAAVARDPAIDVVAAYALHEPDAVDLATAMPAGRVDGVPLVAGVGGLAVAAGVTRSTLIERGIAVTTDPTGLAAATAALVDDSRARHRRDARSAPDGASLPTCDTERYDEAQAKDVLDELGIMTTRRCVCDDRAAAHGALADLGAPVAVKLLDDTVLHKTDIGGVRLGIRDPHELDRALDHLERVGGRRFLVESMAKTGVDLVVGAHRDGVFGPIVLLGLGGVAAEALDDVAVRLAPLDRLDAAEMATELQGRRLLEGWRDLTAVDLDALATILVDLGRLLAARPRLETIEINPLRQTTDGLVALDAVITTTPGGPDE